MKLSEIVSSVLSLRKGASATSVATPAASPSDGTVPYDIEDSADPWLTHQRNQREYDRAWGEIYKEFGSFYCWDWAGEGWTYQGTVGGRHLFRHRSILGFDETVWREVPETPGWELAPSGGEEPWKEEFSAPWQAEHVGRLRRIGDKLEQILYEVASAEAELKADTDVPPRMKELIAGALATAEDRARTTHRVVASAAYLAREHPASTFRANQVRRLALGNTERFGDSLVAAASALGEDRARTAERSRRLR